MPLAPAFRLGPYEVLELLSAGSMGEVYRARDVRLAREVAVKVLPRPFAGDGRRLALFEKEAQAAGALNHPNILAIFDVGRHDDIAFVVSELIDGLTLRDRLAAGRLPEPAVLDYGAQTARGLAAAHARGIVHRDLKPENLMLTRDDRVKIVDFGIAKVAATDGDASDGHGETANSATVTRTLPGTVIGTIAYMSPEQLRGEPVDHRTDIFSLGIILHEMASGRNPFLQATTAETMTAILRDEPPPLDDAAADFQRVVRRALEKNREARFQSAADIAAALDVCARVRPAAAGPTGWAGADLGPATIAVLPFVNVSADPDNEYFSDGLTEELIQALTRVRGLQVVAWHSAAQMKGRVQDARAVGRELRVRTVLAGSVRRAGDRVRISVRLIDVASGVYLWSESYDRRLQDVFAIQEEIARAIVETLAAKLVAAPAALAVPRPANIEAHNLYLRGRFFWNKRTGDGLRRSVDYFQRAVEADETSAVAYAGLADAYCLLADYGLEHPGDVMPRARSAALRALELDPRSAEAHASFGLIRCVYDWEWTAGEALFRRAFELNPGYATAHHWFATDALAMLGRFEEASEHLNRAVQLDPLSLIVHEGLAYLCTLTRRYDDAIAGFRSLMDMEPSYYKAYTSMGRAYIHKHMFREAIAMLEKGRAMAGDMPGILGALGQAHALAGNRALAEQVLGELSDMSSHRHVPSSAFALVHAGLGETATALDWLERGCAQHEIAMVAINVHPGYDVLRDEPRFTALLRAMRFIS